MEVRWEFNLHSRRTNGDGHANSDHHLCISNQRETATFDDDPRRQTEHHGYFKRVAHLKSSNLKAESRNVIYVNIASWVENVKVFDSDLQQRLKSTGGFLFTVMSESRPTLFLPHTPHKFECPGIISAIPISTYQTFWHSLLSNNHFYFPVSNFLSWT